MIDPTKWPEWPAELAAMAAAFKPEPCEPTLEFQPDRGPPKKRPATSPVNCLVARVSLSRPHQEIFDAFVRHTWQRPFWFPRDGGRMVAAFASRPETVGGFLVVQLRQFQPPP